MKLYRFLTGPDDSSFCHRVTEAISNGWQLVGAPTMTYDAENKKIVCGQAITKEVSDKTYDPSIKLSDY